MFMPALGLALTLLFNHEIHRLIAFSAIPPFLPYLLVLAGLGLGWGFNTVMAFIATLLGINSVAQPAAASLFFSIAAGAILIGLVSNSYNLAYLDELTNLHSRRALKQQLLALGKRYSSAMVDIDHFKKLNDTYGHTLVIRSCAWWPHNLPR